MTPPGTGPSPGRDPGAEAGRPPSAGPGGRGFRIEAEDGSARAGVLRLGHGEIATPAFLPVGTRGTVKALAPSDLSSAAVPGVVANAYHLYLRPGTGVIRQVGGLHRFMGWEGPLVTSSGGYQIRSLAGVEEVDDRGVAFRSHLDGSRHRFTPEKAVEVQAALGSDVVTALDRCPPERAGRERVRAATRRTLRWLERCRDRHRELAERAERVWSGGGDGTPEPRAPDAGGDGPGRATDADAGRATPPGTGPEPPLSADAPAPLPEEAPGPPWAPGLLFPVVHGGSYRDLRLEALERTLEAGDWPGLVLGGLSKDEPREVTLDVLEVVAGAAPRSTARHLAGTGYPADLLGAIRRGVDLFDSSAPTRNGRNGTGFTSRGTVHVEGARFAGDRRPLEPGCGCACCRNHSRAYLRHLFAREELLGLRLLSLHNVAFLVDLTSRAREAILAGEFDAWSRRWLERYRNGEA